MWPAPERRWPVQVIGAGFARTGTLSLRTALETLGYGPCYHMMDVMSDGRRVRQWLALARGAPAEWDKIFAGYHSAVDWPVAAYWRALADAFPEANLAPPPGDRADYYRWIFFTSGPVEAAFSNKAAGWDPTPERQRMFGYGNYDLAINTFEKALAGKEYIAADHFTAADLFVGANVNFMLAFNLLEPRPVFVDYARRMTDRPAYERAREIDGKLIAEIEARKSQPQPA